MQSGLSVVIPNYNGEALLAENMPSILSALQSWGGDYEVIVVDDFSSDGSCRLLADDFPKVHVIANQENMGFSRSCNIGMRRAKYPIAFCINNDVRAEGDFITPVLEHFADRDVFAVTPNILAERDGRNQGIVYGLYGKGFIKGGFALLEERGKARDNLYAIGACVAYDMEKFFALGGFSEIYTPYLFEDVDLSYRAWKRGWKSIYEPGATVHHLSSATIGRTKKRTKRTIYFRNRFLFHWINLTDPMFIVLNVMHTLFRLAVSFLWLDITYYAAFCGALKCIPEAIDLRRDVKANLKLGDAEILSRTAGKSR